MLGIIMYKKFLFLSLIPLCLFAGKKKNGEEVRKDGNGCDIGRYAGVGIFEEFAKHGRVPDLENVSTGFARDIGGTFIKGAAEIAAAPSTKVLTDDFGKNAGATAATALGAAALPATAAGMAALAAGTATAIEVQSSLIGTLVGTFPWCP